MINELAPHSDFFTFCMDTSALWTAVREDPENGKNPFAVVASAGTTNPETTQRDVCDTIERLNDLSIAVETLTVHRSKQGAS